ncbi:MAG: polyprenyl diphosphate synthase [Candidatus Paceibacterota bacterium]
MSTKYPKFENLPRHIAFIPDGNRRWAKARGLAPWMGHYEGFKAVEKVFKACFDMNIGCVSLWAASRDNILKRDPEEIKYLLNLFAEKFSELADEKFIHKQKVKITFFGDWQELCPEKVVKAIEKCHKKTTKYHDKNLNIFVGYSGTKEMIDACTSIASAKAKNKDLLINGELVKANLYTKDLPPVDYVIRTGGEPHNSDGFMMWDTANAQIFNSTKHWPDFKEKELIETLEEYNKRERRLGK